MQKRSLVVATIKANPHLYDQVQEAGESRDENLDLMLKQGVHGGGLHLHAHVVAMGRWAVVFSAVMRPLIVYSSGPEPPPIEIDCFVRYDDPPHWELLLDPVAPPLPAPRPAVVADDVHPADPHQLITWFAERKFKVFSTNIIC